MFFSSPSTSAPKDDLKRLITQTDGTSMQCCVGLRKRIRVMKPQAHSTTPLCELRCPLGPTNHLCNFSRVKKSTHQNFSHHKAQHFSLQPTYLPTYFPTFLCLPSCLPTYLPTYLPGDTHVRTPPGHERVAFDDRDLLGTTRRATLS